MMYLYGPALFEVAKTSPFYKERVINENGFND